MKLEKALGLTQPNQYLARRGWIQAGILIRLMDSAKTLEQLHVNLTPESLAADDWEIFEVTE